MAAIIAGVVSAVAAVASTGYGISSAEKAKKAAKKGSKRDTTPTFTPQGQAMQDQMLRLLFQRMSGTPQSAADYMSRGPQPVTSLNDIPFNQRKLLGAGTGLPQVSPANVSPQVLAALERLGIRQPGGTQAPSQALPGSLRPTPPRIPLTGAHGLGTKRY